MASSMFGRDNLLEFLYVPYVFLYVLIYFVASVLICFYLLDRKTYFSRFSQHQRPNADCCSWTLCCCPSLALPLIKFEAAYQGLGGNLGCLVLFLIRLVGTVCVFYYCAMRYWDVGLESFGFFEAWTSLAALVYLVLAFLASLFTALLWFRPLVNPAASIDIPTWSPTAERYAALLLVLRSLALSNCLFIVVTKLALYRVHDDAVHLLLAPAAALAADLLASHLPHRAEHYWLAVLLFLAYLVVMWVAVFTGQMDWPYRPLRVAQPVCFAYYSVLLLVHAGTHALAVGVCTARNAVLSIPPRSYMRQPELNILPKLDLDGDDSSPWDDRLPHSARSLHHRAEGKEGDGEEGGQGEEDEESARRSPSPVSPVSPSSPGDRRENADSPQGEQRTAGREGDEDVPVAIARSFYGHL